MGIALPTDLPHYRYADYLQWEGRWELVDGIPYAMAPAPAIQHQRISNRLAGLLDAGLADCERCLALPAVDWKVDDFPVVCPDNLVICHEPENQNYLTRAPALIFEILSPSTAARDEGLKYRLYEAEGVRYYAIVNAEERVVKVYRLRQGCYVKEADLSRESFEFDLGPCRLVLDFSRIWT